MTIKIIALSVLATLILFGIGEFLWIKFAGRPVPIPEIPRGEQTIGQGPGLRFAVLGDSTTISQGGDYTRGYAVASAEFLAKNHTVTWANFGVSGARAQNVAEQQLAAAVAFKPDVALVGVGANDVTHLTSPGAVRESLRKIVAGLRQANPQVQVVLTGAPDMGSVPRLPQPLRFYAGQRTAVINEQVKDLMATERLLFAPIAEKTGPVFRAHPELFAADKFHPTAEGYDVWTPVVLGTLVVSQPDLAP